jgi:hypothetical protein
MALRESILVEMRWGALGANRISEALRHFLAQDRFADPAWAIVRSFHRCFFMGDLLPHWIERAQSRGATAKYPLILLRQEYPQNATQFSKFILLYEKFLWSHRRVGSPDHQPAILFSQEGIRKAPILR